VAAISSNGTGGGNWSVSSTWSGGVVPGVGDSVTIVAGDTVTVDSTSITFGSSPASNGDALIINGTLNFGTISSATTFTCNGGIVVNSGGDITGDANGYINYIQIDNGTTNVNYPFRVLEGGGLHLTDSGARSTRYVEIASNASAGQPNIVVDTDVSSDWKAGDTIIVCTHVQNGTDEKKEIQSISGTTITLTTNLSAAHNTGASVYWLSRGWVIQPVNDSYRIRYISLINNTGTKNIDADNILFRKYSDGGSGKTGLYVSLGVGEVDMCATEGTGGSPLHFLTENQTMKNWLFAFSRNNSGFTSSFNYNTRNNFNNCYYVQTYPQFWIGSLNALNTWEGCRFDHNWINGYVFGGYSNIKNTTRNCLFKANYKGWVSTNLSTGNVSENDTYDSTLVVGVEWGGGGSVGEITVINPTNNASTQYNNNSPAYGCNSYVFQHNGNSEDNRWYQRYTVMQTSGSGLSDTTTRTAGTYALSITPSTSTNDKFSRKWAIKAGRNIAITGYVMKNSSYGSSTRPTVYLESGNGEINTSATMSDVNDTWEQFIVSGGVTEDTTFTFSMSGQSANSGAKCYFADMYIYVRKYGNVYVEYRIDSTQFITGVFSPEVIATNTFITMNEADAYAQTGISYDGSTITITEDHTLLEIYQYFQAWAVQKGNRHKPVPFNTNDGVNFTVSCDMEIDGCSVSGGGSIDLGSNTMTLSNGGDYDGVYIDSTGRNVPVSITGFVSGSRIQIYDNDRTTELFNDVVNNTSKKYWAIYTADTELRIRVMYVNGTSAKKWWTYTANMTNTGLSVAVSQEDDDVYNINAIDGSTVTECSVSGTTIRIYVDDPDNTITAQRIYNWYMYLLSTETGIADQDGQYITAIDPTHYVFNNSMKIVNQDTSNPLNIMGANIVPETGDATDIFDLSNGASIALNFNRVEYAHGLATKTDVQNASILSFIR